VNEHVLHLGDPRSEWQGRPCIVEGLDGPGAGAAREAQHECGIFGLNLPEGARAFAGAEDAVFTAEREDLGHLAADPLEGDRGWGAGAPVGRHGYRDWANRLHCHPEPPPLVGVCVRTSVRSVIEHPFCVKGGTCARIVLQRGAPSPPATEEGAQLMKVILTANVPKLGKAGDQKEVAGGYAKNFLFANGLAIPAVGGAASAVAAGIASRAAKQDRQRGEAEGFAQRISSTTLTMGVKVGEGGKLFGSITTKEIAEALDRRGISVEKHQVMLDEPLKQLGSYKVQIKVAAHLVAEVTVVVEPKG